MNQAVLQFQTQTLFGQMVHLVDAVVLQVLSCYLLITIGSGFFERTSLEHPPWEYTVLNEPRMFRVLLELRR